MVGFPRRCKRARAGAPTSLFAFDYCRSVDRRRRAAMRTTEGSARQTSVVALISNALERRVERTVAPASVSRGNPRRDQAPLALQKHKCARMRFCVGKPTFVN